jgi:LemA protein
MILILLGIIVLLGLYILTTYNRLVTIKTRIGASIQEIGNQLKRQADLIPNLETSAKSYLKHEKDIFDKLTSARKAVESAVSSKDVNKMAEANSRIQDALGGLKVILESNPQLRGADVIQALMDELRDTADKVMYSRRTLIDLTADYNTLLATFPSNLIAGSFGFKAETGFTTPTDTGALTVTPDEMKTPKVKLE